MAETKSAIISPDVKSEVLPKGRTVSGKLSLPLAHALNDPDTASEDLARFMGLYSHLLR